MDKSGSRFFLFWFATFKHKKVWWLLSKKWHFFGFSKNFDDLGCVAVSRGLIRISTGSDLRVQTCSFQMTPFVALCDPLKAINQAFYFFERHDFYKIFPKIWNRKPKLRKSTNLGWKSCAHATALLCFFFRARSKSPVAKKRETRKPEP